MPQSAGSPWKELEHGLVGEAEGDAVVSRKTLRARAPPELLQAADHRRRDQGLAEAGGQEVGTPEEQVCTAKRLLAGALCAGERVLARLLCCSELAAEEE
eukprot:4159936-Alexandrium_andersonii.AAC.1